MDEKVLLWLRTTFLAYQKILLKDTLNTYVGITHLAFLDIKILELLQINKSKHICKSVKRCTNRINGQTAASLQFPVRKEGNFLLYQQLKELFFP